MAIHPTPSERYFETITRRIDRHAFQTSGIPFILDFNAQELRTQPFQCWHSLSHLDRLPTAIHQITTFGELLQCSRFNEYPEIKLFLRDEYHMRMKCQDILDFIKRITIKQERSLIPCYTPLVLRYLQTRNGSDLIVVQDEYFEISSIIRSHYKTLRTFEKALKNTHIKLIEMKSCGEKQLEIIDVQLSYGDPIAQTLIRLEKAIASKLPSQDLNTRNKLIIDRGINALQSELDDINPNLKDPKYRYDSLPQLHEFVCEAAKKLGSQILKANTLNNEDIIMSKLYKRIGSPNIKGDPIKWMRRDLHYYLSGLRSILTERVLRDVQQHNWTKINGT